MAGSANRLDAGLFEIEKLLQEYNYGGNSTKNFKDISYLIIRLLLIRTTEKAISEKEEIERSSKG